MSSSKENHLAQMWQGSRPYGAMGGGISSGGGVTDLGAVLTAEETPNVKIFSNGKKWPLLGGVRGIG